MTRCCRQSSRRQHRFRCGGLVHRQCRQRCNTDGANRRQRRQRQAAALHQYQHQRRDRHHQQQRAEIVDAAAPMMLRRFRQEGRDHDDRRHADRQVDPEHQLPTHLLDQERAEQWPQHCGDAEHARHQTLHVRAFGRRIDVAEDCDGDRLHAAGAEALQRAEQDQRQQVAGEAAQRGTDQEQAGTGIEHLLASVDIGEPAIDRNAHRLRQQIDREHPRKQIEPAQIGNDRRHRGGNDGALHRRHEGRHHARREHQRAASRGRRRDVNRGGRRLEPLVGHWLASLWLGRGALSVIVTHA